MKENLLFYKEYQKFYQMADNCNCFKEYCKKAFGVDFSQDGFSDIHQVELISQYVSLDHNSYLLDIGSGNGKMLKYLQRITGAHISGFDYSENAIATAQADNLFNSYFEVGLMDEIEYPHNYFDLIVSMDTVYFSKNMVNLIKRVFDWLKDGGTFFVGYQEGDIMPKTDDCNSTIFAKAVRQNNLKYQVINYTEQTYNMLKTKREAIVSLQESFEK